MIRVQAILFDMDGVLVDSEPYWQRFWREEVFADVENGDPCLEDVTGRNFRESLVELAQTYGLPGGPERYARQFETAADTVYGEHVSITSGIPELFETLRERGFDVGIVSSAPVDWIETVVERFDLTPVDVVVSAEHLDDPGKPEPFIYEYAAAELDVDSTACIVVEDSVNGVRAAAQAGSTVIRFCQGSEVKPTNETDFIANSPQDLRRTLLEVLS
ncbi:HAD family hydrolase [Haladaptatus halobius]|uniref:HAD family hydrolase n=1 Tax=Haladaptatus halobius TaxID=2884875 RepID=UPI001D0A096E|nr:HAD family phosphatase [Haladaptatus halobius]